MYTGEGNAFYSNSQCMEDYLDDDNTMKMIKRVTNSHQPSTNSWEHRKGNHKRRD